MPRVAAANDALQGGGDAAAKETGWGRNWPVTAANKVHRGTRLTNASRGSDELGRRGRRCGKRDTMERIPGVAEDASE